jgi:hypothetical protein
MKKYKFTLLIKQYFDHEIEAESEDEARQMFLDGGWKDELCLADPDETEAEDFMGEL